jgi:hypothetical protein
MLQRQIGKNLVASAIGSQLHTKNDQQPWRVNIGA